MIDENYHIEDIDDIFDSQNEPVKEAAAKTEPVKARIIFEDSTSNQAKKEEPENAYSQAYEEGDYGQEGSEKPSGEKRKPLIDNVKKKTLTEKLEGILLAAYKDKPNTVVATIVGIIIAILFLWIGFLKTLVICLVVFVANIIGQLFDQNPFVVGVFETIVRKFK
ncbi:DUF2273 domain-containing protein [Peptostreptococcus stomatis]|uniref:DUF2273 domain-containing protein n=1 Tax=Peptostreptococcus stomatis TaxID=341694 RepID=UPI00280386E9|nr:DUF2273 domain-containing protein [Peptostreptococcus stomatis]